LWRRFKSYVNLSGTEPKLRKILAAFPMTTYRECLSQLETQPSAAPEVYAAGAV
jgi:hypothetical protein